MSELCLSVPKLAKHLGIRRGRINAAIASGELAAFRVGNLYRVRLSDIPPHLRDRWESSEPAQRLDLPSGQMVYFLGAADYVKIGFTTDLRLRVVNLQPGSPHRLELLAHVPDATLADEREYPRRFHEHRAHGEWFCRAPEIDAEIDRLNHRAGRFPGMKES